jgi:CheY-like chemotaxis protein
MNAVSRRTEATALRVLLVEDDPVVCETLSAILSLSGIEATCSGDGHLALRFWQNAPSDFDVVMTDHRMPLMGGREFVTQLRRAGGQAVPVVVHSACLSVDDHRDYRAQGVTHFLRKPADIDVLVSTLHQAAHPPQPV